ncbi:hypothetical protein NCTGTJJY_CDS0292 [Serratia phage 92A1]|nr:hypothetical protein NCTGTJJY_CDS0292 [Serratia phage 92A1]
MKKLIEFAFQTPTEEIFSDMQLIRESVKDAWDERMYFSAVVLFIIFSLFLIVMGIIGGIEIVGGYIYIGLRGIVILIAGLIGAALGMLVKNG